MIVLDLSILNQKGTPMFNSDIFANRPAFGIVGRIFISIDTAAIYRDTGTAWDLIADGGSASTNIYNSNGTLSANRVVSSGGFSLTFNPSTTFDTTLTAASNTSSLAIFGVNRLSYASGFSSNNIGNLFGGSSSFNLQTFAGSATFANSNIAANSSINSVDFSTGGSTITMTQATGLRVMAGHINMFQYQGTNSGTITHAAVSQNLGFYRPTAATGILTITNAYSHLINALDDYGAGFTFTNRWGIYQAGASDLNYFAANMLLGSTTNNGNRLQVTGTAYISGNLGLGTTNAQFPLEIVTPNANPIAIVSTRENANGPSYFVGRCIGGTIASPTDQVGQGAIFQSYGYRGGAYREHGYLIFNGVNATSGGGIAGSLNLFLSNDSTSNTQIASATATSFNIGGDYTQTTYKFKVSGISQFSNGAASLTANILNTTTAASGVTGYGLAIESEATAASSYNLICRNIDGSNVYGGISTATSQVGFWSIGFAPTGTIGNRLSVSGAMSVGSGSYLTTAAPSNGAMIEGTVLIGTNTNSGEKLVVNGTVRTTNTITIDDTSFPRLALKRSTSSSQADIAFIDGANIKWSIGQAVISVGNNLDFYAYATSRGILVLKESGVVNMPNLPTSSAGLVSGDIYNNLGILTIV